VPPVFYRRRRSRIPRATMTSTRLEKQHFDFHSPEAGQLAVSAARNEAMVLSLIDHGASVNDAISIAT
jgi:hypothetical protein